ncbi:MAG: LysR family transcriptional regulator, partial [Clostridia bacterium]|nr:LysR family transcriptional regulator [Clostridia bacterium]
MVMQVDIFHFELFDSVAQTQSLTRTAELFNITQPAVSHNLKKLEDIYGVKLFERTSRGIVLTGAGRELLPFVRNILAVMADAHTRMLNIAAGRIGHIRIASIPALLNYVAQCVKIMHEKMPSVQIDLDLYEGPEMVSYMALNSYDFFFSTDAQLDSLSDYGHALIARDSLDLFVSEDFKDKIDQDNLSASLLEIPFVSVPMSDQQLATPIFNILNLSHVKSNFVNFYTRVETVLLAVSVG